MDRTKQRIGINHGVAIAGDVIFASEPSIDDFSTEELVTMKSRCVRDLAKIRKKMLPWVVTLVVAGMSYLFALEEAWLSVRQMLFFGFALIIFIALLYRANSVHRDVEKIVMTKLRTIESELYIRNHGIDG